MSETPQKKTTAKKTAVKKTTAKTAPKKTAPKVEEEPVAPSLDVDEPDLGWTTLKGRYPSKVKDIYADDPPKYTKDQLPDPEKLKAAGYSPVIPEHQKA